MPGFLKKISIAVTLLIAGVARTTFAMPEIMPLDEIQNGMHGVAYTIVDNTGVIKNFSVDIVGMLNNGKGNNSRIMAEASGAVVDRTGGVLQGMSGSPVYVNGKLVGALSAGFKDLNPYTFLITPIESMLNIWDFPDTKIQNPYFKVDIADVTEDEESAEDEVVEDESAEEVSAVFFGGFNNNSLNFLKNELKPFGFKNFYSSVDSGSGDIKYDAELKPGGSVGVAVVCGDFYVGATGTVTAVDGNKILAFGHPFTHSGNVNYFMTDAPVIGSVKGETGGMKVARVGDIIGRINQDRDNGVAGVIGRFPAVVPITVTVNDNSRNHTETYSAKIAYNEDLIPLLGASIAYASLSKTIDTTSEGTVTVDFGIKTNVVESGTLSRQNMFYGAGNVGQFSIMELLQGLSIVCSNTVEESNIFGIDVNMTIDSERKTASLVSATPSKKLVKPGETVDLTVKLQPYRKPVEEIVVPYTVPLARAEGPMTLDIHGGALVQLSPAGTGVILPSTQTPAQSYKDSIKKFVEANRNNQLIVEPGASLVAKTEKQIKQDIKRAKKIQKRIEKSGKKTELPKNNGKVDTGYIIDNVIQVTINVDKI